MDEPMACRRIREAMTEREVSIDQLAADTGMHPQKVRRVITRGQDPKGDDIRRIAEALQIDLGWPLV